MKKFVLSLDQGTTSSRALVFNQEMEVVGLDQIPLRQIYPQSGWVEHDPVEIWQATLKTAKKAVALAGIDFTDIAAIGVTNQRETVVIWDRVTGKPLFNAIVWQDRRTSDYCQGLKKAGHEEMVRAKTGLLLDPYFSASKIRWVLDHVEGARQRALNGELCFGTIDSWLIWNLTGGRVHKTDATNASRTMLFNIIDGVWDEELLALFDIPAAILPQVCDCMADFGETETGLFGVGLPITGVAGDQHAALIGQACFEPLMMKSTYGTGCFTLMNIGESPVLSSSKLLTTLAYQFNGKRFYALEGSIFVAGAAVQWLVDEVGLIAEPADCDALAASSDLSDPVCLVPAFAGLGAPYWQPDVRGALLNLSRGTGRAEIVRATLESVGFQSKDLFEAMRNDVRSLAVAASYEGTQSLRVDGGLTRSDWAMQFLADILGCSVELAQETETTALGAAFLCGHQVGLYGGFEDFSRQWTASRRFEPQGDARVLKEKYQGWLKAVRTLTCSDDQ